MTNASETEKQVVSSQQVLQTIKEMRNRLEAVNKEKTEPIAIVGVGCRFPGNANDSASFWQLLHEGIDAVGEVPSGRWDVDAYYDPKPDTPGKTYTKQGGYIQEVDRFDPLFFGISPREAVSLDPQQRLLLEVGWEALENAGIAPSTLRNSKTGVYVGICTDDYSERIKNDLTLVDSHFGTGNARSMAVGRLSHLLGLQGPNIQLDTACSSSLVTVHLACQSLRLKESNLAIAGGVNLILWPFGTIGRCQLKAVAPDGRCKTFDASGDGYGQGEGCGMVVLKRLSDAMADGDRVLAVIRGSAVNHDGPSSGLTVPNKMAQKELIQQALQNARIEASQVSYVEAHGTGTPLGDPIELESLAAVYGKNRPINQPLVVGSVKTNIGHLEAAAGASALIKVVLSLQNQEIPPHLHLKNPNPHIPWHQLPIVVPTAATPWKRGEQPRIAGISSFGISGTNAHIILEEAPLEVKSQEAKGKSEDFSERPLHLLTLSAKTETALAELVGNYQNYLENNPELEIEDVCYTANTGRSHFNHRLTVIAADKTELSTKLGDRLAGKEVTGICSAYLRNTTTSPKVAFLFTGQGSQYLNMGRQLYETQPVFRRTLDQCNQILSSFLEKPLLDVLYCDSENGKENSLLDETAYTQPALFSIEYALAQLWQSWGVKPDVVMGHSVGEYVAACIAGVFSLEDGLKLIATRGQLMQELPSGGEMVSVFASESLVSEAIAPYTSQVNIAAINGPESIVISGVGEAIQAICESFSEKGIKTKSLQVSHAFHSPLMEPMLVKFAVVAKEVTYAQPQIDLISNVTGKLATAEIATPEYWVNHIRQPVRFTQSMETLHQENYQLFLEIGPKPILLGMGRQCLPEDVGSWLPSLRPPQTDWQQILNSLGQLYAQGVTVDWSEFDRDYSRSKVTLPSYPFQRQHYWQEVKENGHKSQDETLSTPIVKLLNQGETQQLVDEVELAGELTEQERQVLPKLLELLVKRQQNYLEFKGGTVHEYYNAVATLGQVQAGSQADGLAESPYLTFGLFPEKVPDFSWIKCLTEPNQENHLEMIFESQKELRQLLFAQVDFSACQKVLDFGCGYASDLVDLAQKYEHLQLNGYTISSEQAKFGSTRVRESQLQERVKIYNRDSAKDEFPNNYDLVFGFEVAHHILDKQALFTNISNHLNQQGYLVLADFISNSDIAIDHEETSSYFITKSEWVEFLSQHHLQLVAAIDVSPEISNFLYDPDFEGRLEQLYQSNQDENVRSGFKSYYQLGKVLSKEIASYVLLTAQKQEQLSTAEIAEWNQQILAQLTSYSEVTPQRWLYELEWQAQQAKGKGKKAKGNWLLFAEDGAVASGLKEKLGDGCVIVAPGNSYQQIDEKHYQINPTAPEEFKLLLNETKNIQGIVHLWSMATNSDRLETAIEYGCASLLHLVQALAETKPQQMPNLWVVTQGAMSVVTGEAVQVQQSPVWGLGRVITQEHPEMQCRLLDLEASTKAEDVAGLLYQELLSPEEENQIAYRQGERRVARLVRRQQQISTEEKPEINIVAEGSYLITGGLGALGLQLAQWLVDKGAQHLVLTGRRTPSETAKQTIAQLEQRGTKVSVLLGDVSVEQDVAGMIEQINTSLPPLHGIIHAAGVLDDGVLQQMNWERFTKVMAPKVKGAWHLHQFTQDLPLDFFVCFSSAASFLGSTGQGNYAAANAFMDGLVYHRRSSGLPGLSVNWAAWGEGGMAARLASQFQSRIRSLGMSSIPPEQGLEVLTQLLAESATQVGVIPINWSQFVAQLPAGMTMPVLEEFMSSESVVTETKNNEFLVELQKAKASDRPQIMTNYLQGVVGKLLGFPESELPDTELGFFDMGMDSLLSLELRNLLQKSFSCSVSSTVLFEYTNIEALAEHLTTEVLAEDLETTVETSDKDKPETPAIPQEEVTDAIAQKFQQIQNLLNNN
ncbi:type I polyketide synthase [Dapis sp. BLCC M126]|uniref:type I polyketide synthase n=1 Tax=Dapis sp. BLCC M126 TaxID=3400189 RepID=UPI003CFA7AC7